ncbi:MAG: ATP-binding cassette domain-containing protein [Candidatus Dormibacteria bacterium]
MTAAGAIQGSDPILQMLAVTRRYGTRSNPVVALSQVSMEVRPQDRLGVVGESGSGKSTLARLLLILEDPDEGEVRFQGRSMSGKSRSELAELRRAVQIVFQDPFSSLDPRLRVGDSIAEPLRSLGIQGDHRSRVQELLDAVGLPAGSARMYPHQFSGGQRQRVAIARALASQPRVLVADEAVSALDVSVRAQVLNLLARLVERFGLTLVFISHDMAVVRHICTRVVVLYRGQVVEQGPVEQVFRDPQHPYTQALISSVPTLGGRIVSPPTFDWESPSS